MDPLSHILIAYLVFPGNEGMIWFLFFALFPDIVDLLFVPKFLNSLVRGKIFMPKDYPNDSYVKRWRELRAVTHSYAVFAVAFLMVGVITGQFWLPLLGWFLHLLLDLFSHATAPSLQFWPFTDKVIRTHDWTFKKAAVTYGLCILVLLLIRIF